MEPLRYTLDRVEELGCQDMIRGGDDAELSAKFPFLNEQPQQQGNLRRIGLRVLFEETPYLDMRQLRVGLNPILKLLGGLGQFRKPLPRIGEVVG